MRLLLLLEVAAALVRPGRLVLLRHGESLWNKENRFTGWEDVPLTAAGEEEAREAANMLVTEEEDTRIDVVYTSVLCRAIRTSELFVQEYANAHAEATPPPICTRWRLNERHYGVLQGLDKAETLAAWEDRAALKDWRLSFAGKPPPMEPDHPYYSRAPARLERLRDANMYGRTAEYADGGEALVESDVPLTESIADTVVRVRPFWVDELLPSILAGQTALVVGHANCLRALVSCIQSNIDDDSLASLGLPNALPLVYEFAPDGSPLEAVDGCCYVPPLQAHYLGDACVVFNALDVDGSGALDRDEMATLDVCRASFEALDRDGDGMVDAEELAAACGDVLIREADSNGDGLVNFNEYMAWWTRQKQRGTAARR